MIRIILARLKKSDCCPICGGRIVTGYSKEAITVAECLRRAAGLDQTENPNDRRFGPPMKPVKPGTKWTYGLPYPAPALPTDSKRKAEEYAQARKKAQLATKKRQARARKARAKRAKRAKIEEKYVRAAVTMPIRVQPLEIRDDKRKKTKRKKGKP